MKNPSNTFLEISGRQLFFPSTLVALVVWACYLPRGVLKILRLLSIQVAQQRQAPDNTPFLAPTTQRRIQNI